MKNVVIGSFTISCLEEYTEFEDAIEECGYGKFHYILLMVCGWANASDAIEVKFLRNFRIFADFSVFNSGISRVI